MDGVGSVEPYFSRVLIDRLSDSLEPDGFVVDGTVVFVDVSGFTALSERLARRGREGAEQITDTIERCFRPLLDIASKRGGHLLKFGGDALLLLFEGSNHELAGCGAAIEMQQAMRVVGRADQSPARVRLRMSVGVHSGPLNLFLVGTSHRELVVAGATATAVVDAEGAASAGQIVVTPSTAAALPPAALGEVIGPGRLLRARTIDPEAVASPGSTRGDRDPALSMRAVPSGLRGQLRSADQSPEHRVATIAFLHFDGTDQMIEDEGAPAAADALHELMSGVQDAVDDLGVCFLGTDVDRNGGKIILSAGVPTNTGNDEERMLIALRRIATADRRIGVRIGVNRGPVFAGPVGPPLRRTFTVMGDTVNLAARLMATASAGQVLSTSSVLSESATRFDTEPLEPFSVKGKAEPIQAYAVMGVSTEREPERSGGIEQFPLIGRGKELALLEAALDEAVESSRGRLVDMLGESGIGKTRLIEEARTQVDRNQSDVRWFSVTCEAYATTSPYYVWRDLLRQVLDVPWETTNDLVADRLRHLVETRVPDLIPWLPLLAVPVDVEVPPTSAVDELHPDARRQRMCEVLSDFLEAVLDHPAVFEFENAHWIDEASCVLLDHLAGEVTSRPWLLCVLRHDGKGGYTPRTGAEDVLGLELAPLARSGTVDLARLATLDAPAASRPVRGGGRSQRRESAVPPRPPGGGRGGRRRGAPRLGRGGSHRDDRPVVPRRPDGRAAGVPARDRLRPRAAQDGAAVVGAEP